MLIYVLVYTLTLVFLNSVTSIYIFSYLPNRIQPNYICIINVTKSHCLINQHGQVAVKTDIQDKRDQNEYFPASQMKKGDELKRSSSHRS